MIITTKQFCDKTLFLLYKYQSTCQQFFQNEKGSVLYFFSLFQIPAEQNKSKKIPYKKLLILSSKFFLLTNTDGKKHFYLNYLNSYFFLFMWFIGDGNKRMEKEIL